MSGMNKAIIIGNVGKDPEVRTTQSGMRTCNFSIATSESWTDKASGERKEQTEWHRIVIFNDRIIDVAEKYVRKGSKVAVEGKIQTRKWTDQAGVEKYTTEIVIGAYRGELVLLSDGRDRDDNASPSPAAHTAPARSSTTQRPARREWDKTTTYDPDDEIPF